MTVRRAPDPEPFPPKPPPLRHYPREMSGTDVVAHVSTLGDTPTS
jgi:hypothetical protein